MRPSALVAAVVLVLVAAAGCFGDDAADDDVPGDDEAGGDGDGGDGSSRSPPTPAPDPPAQDDPDPSGIALHPVLEGLERPLIIAPMGDGSGRLVIGEQEGTAWTLHPDGRVSLFADLTDRVGSQANEQGLLGIAFHPEAAANGAVVVSYTDLAGDSVLSRFQLGDDGALDGASEEVLLQVAQPFANHNGGHVVYGPDGMLYYGLGDGGLAGDPMLNAQDPATLLGSILRLDVGPSGPYEVPQDNPFTDDPVRADEVWVYGVRNPWRFSFDPAGGLWIGDVGQDVWEEVDHLGAGEAAGANLGWNLFEGSYQYPTGLPAAGLLPLFVFPVAEYDHASGCSITGGHVAVDEGVPDLLGAYVYADFCSGIIWRLDGPDAEAEIIMQSGLPISSFGLDAAGRLHLTAFDGTLYRFTPGP